MIQGISEGKCVEAQIAYIARIALAYLRDHLASLKGKQGVDPAAGGVKPMVYISLHFFERQWRQGGQQGDALTKLAQGRTSQLVSQFWLSCKHDLKQLRARRLKIGQQPHRFQHRRIEILCFVDDQNGTFILAVLLQKKVEEILEHLNFLFAAMLQVEGEQYPLQ